MKDKNKLIAAIEKNTAEPYKKAVVNEIKSSIRLKTNAKPCIEIGKTKLGGCPDLTKKISWAKSQYDNNYLSFLGQINLKEVEKFDEEKLLPEKGMLYFFFNLDSGDDGKVIFTEEDTGLEKAVPPEEFKVQKKSFFQRLFTGKSKRRILKESQVEIYKEYNIPSWDSLRLERMHKITQTTIKPINAFEEGIFEDLYEEGETESTSNHHLIGNYSGIQNEYHELNFIDFDFKDFEQLKLSDLDKALKWRLLFQFDSDKNLEISYGDWGRVYFFIHEEDLIRRNFNNVRISADCY